MDHSTTQAPLPAHRHVIIIGAGFAGLSTAASLRYHGMDDFVLLEQGPDVGAFWMGNYDRITLHSAWHDLPQDGGLRRNYGMYLTKNELLDYFRMYAERHGLYPFMQFNCRVEQVRRDEKESVWSVATGEGIITCDRLVIATSHSRVPHIPAIEGMRDYQGELLHSRDYRNGEGFRGKNVLVIGSGNSGAEISLDLVEHGAEKVRMWVRGPRHFLSMRFTGAILRLIRLLRIDFTDRAWDRAHQLDRSNPDFIPELRRRDRILRLLSRDLSHFGIRKPEEGPLTESLVHGRIPVYGEDVIRMIRRGEIGIIDGNVRSIVRFTPEGLLFSDGEEPFDAIILATGFDPGLEEFLVDHERLLAWDKERQRLLPITDKRCSSTVEPTLFFPGFDFSAIGGLGLGRWGWEIGGKIAGGDEGG